MLPVAAALRDAGHSVAFASAAQFGALVEAHGLPCFAAGLDWLESEAEQSFPELRTMSLEEQHTWFLTDLFADIAAHRMLPDLLALCRSWKPDLIVSNDFEFAAPVAAELLGLPYAAVGIDLFFPLPIKQQLIGAPLAYLRSAYGLPPYPALDMLYRWLYLPLFPPSFQFPEFALPPTAHPIQPHLASRAPGQTLPASVLALEDRPTVYVTLGTVFNQVHQVFDAVIAGLRDEPVNLVITTGRAEHPLARRALPPHVVVEPYIPLSLLLERCDAVISHAGFGTTMAALRHGLPLLLIPISAHQPFNAMRCAALGVGQVMRCRGQFSQYLGRQTPEVTPAAVRAAVRSLLGEPGYRGAARQLQAQIASMPDTVRAAELLERLAQTRRPLPAQAPEPELQAA
jgi:UDP:flavonoid glycosyltransferase YjiC (YdhE family)